MADSNIYVYIHFRTTIEFLVQIHQQ